MNDWIFFWLRVFFVPIGCEALVSCGLMESLLKVVRWPGEDDHITVSYCSHQKSLQYRLQMLCHILGNLDVTRATSVFWEKSCIRRKTYSWSFTQWEYTDRTAIWPMLNFTLKFSKDNHPHDFTEKLIWSCMQTSFWSEKGRSNVHVVLHAKLTNWPIEFFVFSWIDFYRIYLFTPLFLQVCDKSCASDRPDYQSWHGLISNS